MTRTTDDWEALLDGAADGPWEAERHGDEPVISIRTIVHDPGRYVGDIYGEENARLAAASPEAVAEVVRLRRALARSEDGLHHATQHTLAQGKKLRAQAQQIKRLQAAFNEALDESNAMGEELYNGMARPWPDSSPIDYGLSPGDMEDTDD